MKKTVSLILVLTMIVGLSVGLSTNALAANNDGGVIITTTVYYMPYTFSSTSYNVHNPITGADYTSYAKYISLPDTVSLSVLTVNITYNGTELFVNGTSVSTNSNGQATKNITLDFSSSVVTLDVTYSGGTRRYYVSAYHDDFNVTVALDYSNADNFTYFPVNSYYYNPAFTQYTNIDPVTQTQLDTAAEALDVLDTALANYSLSQVYNVEGGSSPIDALNAFCTTRNLAVDGSSQYINGIGAFDSNLNDYVYLDEDSTATYHYQYQNQTRHHGAGGWMYKVTRGNDTVFPEIGGGTFKLMPGDVVTWIYTCDLGFDVGHPMAP